MLTEVDIQRIMQAKHRLTETFSEPVDYVVIDDNKDIEKENSDADTPINLLRGLI